MMPFCSSKLGASQVKLILVELTAAAARFRGAPVGTAGTNVENNVVHTNLILHVSTPRSRHKEQTNIYLHV